MATPENLVDLMVEALGSDEYPDMSEAPVALAFKVVEDRHELIASNANSTYCSLGCMLEETINLLLHYIEHSRIEIAYDGLSWSLHIPCKNFEKDILPVLEVLEACQTDAEDGSEIPVRFTGSRDSYFKETRIFESNIEGFSAVAELVHADLRPGESLPDNCKRVIKGYKYVSIPEYEIVCVDEAQPTATEQKAMQVTALTGEMRRVGLDDEL